jgi:hypothetical protein
MMRLVEIVPLTMKKSSVAFFPETFFFLYNQKNRIKSSAVITQRVYFMRTPYVMFGTGYLLVTG